MAYFGDGDDPGLLMGHIGISLLRLRGFLVLLVSQLRLAWKSLRTWTTDIGPIVYFHKPELSFHSQHRPYLLAGLLRVILLWRLSWLPACS